MEVSLANLNGAALEELSIPELEELASSDEEDTGTTSAEFGSAEELVCSKASDELSGSAPELRPITLVEESESPSQLAQNRLAMVKQLKRKNLRIFMAFSFFPLSYINYLALFT